MKETTIKNSPRCLIIVGMHRSGTSFTASLLQKAGLNIGDKLLAAAEGNEFGHFENEDFYNFHIRVLSQLNYHSDGWTMQTIQQLNSEEETKAKDIIASNQAEHWGWKDPRTTLFLDFWKKMIPDACFLFVYRKPWEVVDSLFRRNSDKEFIANPSYTFSVWEYYNREILSFFETNKERSILVDIENVIYQTRSVLELINTRLGFNLNIGLSTPFDSSKFVNNLNPIGKVFAENVFPRSVSLYQELQKQSTLLPFQTYNPSGLPLELATNWWYNTAQVHNLQNTIHGLQNTVYGLQNTLQERQNHIEAQQQNITTFQNHVAQLNLTIQYLNDELRWITNSKWWKLRKWFKK